MATRTATYAFSRRVPYLLERGAEQTISAPIRHGSAGALVSPDSGTVTIVKPDGTSLVSGAAVVVSSSIATYTVTPAASETLGEGWEVRWTLVFGGVTYPVYRQDAILCDYVPANTISAVDLYTDLPELEYRIPQSQGERGDDVGWQPQIDAAYYDLINKLLSGGKPVWKIIGVSGYEDWLRTRAKIRCVGAISHGPDSDWAQAAKELSFELRRVEAAFKVSYDADDISIRRGGSPTIRMAPAGRNPWS